MSFLRLENVSHVYSPGSPFEKRALDDVTLDIHEGEVLGIIGSTGSGKSTLIQHLNGILRPTSGRVLVNGEDMWAHPKEIKKFRSLIGLVFQYPEYQLFEETVEKDIAFGPRNMGLEEEEIARRVQEACEFAGVHGDWLDKSPFELSGGQKRRVAIAGVIAMLPRVLVLDEPLAGLDPHGRNSIMRRIKNYRDKTGAAVVIVSHSMENVAKDCERIVAVQNGRIVAEGTPAQVFADADHLRTIGLAPPQLTGVFSRLAADGFPVSPAVYTVDEAFNEIMRVLGK